MNLLFRAIVTGFGMAAGAALYKRFAEELGLEKKRPEPAKDGVADGTSDTPPPADPVARARARG